ncbi:MAG: CBS domain-containing protein [Pyrobaculum sp.]
MPLVKRREMPIKISDIMVRQVVTCRKDEKVKEVAMRMYENKIGSVVIVDGENRPIGIVTERDLIYVLARSLPPDTPVWTVMTENPVVINENALVTEALEKMRSLGIRHLPVVDSAGRLVGIISVRDLIDFTAILMSLYK